MQGNSRKILILSTSYKPLIGGSEIAIEEVTKHLTNFEFDIVTSRHQKTLPDTEKNGNVTIHRVGNNFHLSKILLPKLFLPLAIFLKANSLIKKEHHKIVHVFQASQAAGAAWLLKLFHPELVFILTMQEGKNLKKQGNIINNLRNKIIKNADIITAISSYLKDYVRNINKRAEIVIIPNGVNLNLFNNDPNQLKAAEEKRKELNIKMNEMVIITVSRLVEKNGINDLIESLTITPLKNYETDIKLVIIGDGPLKEKMKEKISSLGLNEKVILLGNIKHDQLPKYLLAADVFVRPSISEGLGNAFLEAMACGVPIIGTRVGGIPDFLEDNVTGLFCNVSNPVDISNKINIILTNTELRNKLIKNGMSLVEKKYSWDNIAQKYSELYNFQYLKK